MSIFSNIPSVTPTARRVAGVLTALATATALAVPAAHAAPSAQAYSWVPVSAPAGCEAPRLKAVSPNGQRLALACGTWTGADGVAHPDAAIVAHGSDVTMLAAAKGVSKPTPQRISDTGWVIGTGTITPSDSILHPSIHLRWGPDGSVTTFPTGGGETWLGLRTVANDGTTLHTDSYFGMCMGTSVVSASGDTVNTPVPAGWKKACLSDGSAEGRYVGVVHDGDPVPEQLRPITWTAEKGLTKLGLPEGWEHASADLISPDGTVIIGRAGHTVEQQRGLNPRYMRFTPDGDAMALPELPTTLWWDASQVANDGTMLGYENGSDAMVWLPDTPRPVALWPLVKDAPVGYQLEGGRYVVSLDARGRVFTNLDATAPGQPGLMGYVQLGHS